MLKRIHHVAISIPPEQRSAAVHFYRDVLGFEEKPVPDSLVSVPIITWFQVGDDELHLLEEANSQGEARRHICFEVDELRPYQRRLAENGEQILSADPIPGRPRFFCYDPAGNRIEFLVEESDS